MGSSTWILSRYRLECPRQRRGSARQCSIPSKGSRVSKAAVVVPSPQAGDVIDLKDPAIAAFLGWLVPGLGHLYQGRTAKGLLYMISILSTFFFGLAISEGKAVYAWWSPDDWRL